MGPRSSITAGKVELDDIQGILRSGYSTLTEAVFLVLAVADVAAAKEWLATAPVTSAAFGEKLSTALHVALTAGGLRRIGLSNEALETFPAEFLAGMSGDESRARRLGDVGSSAPSSWAWGDAPDSTLDAIVILYAESGTLADWRRTIETAGFAAGFRLVQELRTGIMDGYEPFGFPDGLSQPEIDWHQRQARDRRDEYRYRNTIAPGEFVLGYTNEYGLVSDRPFVSADADPAGLLRSFAGDSRRDLGGNGSYLVIRQLEQDVQGFWQYLEKVAGPGDAATRLAERMVGRTRAGAPLAPVRISDTAASSAEKQALNDFDFDDDPEGRACPLGAHIRRANPRNADVPGGRQNWLWRLLRLLGLPRPGPRSDVIASSRFHRILRRGRKYAPSAATGDVSNGLYFVCLNANIGRQFEFIQNAWLESSKFDGLTGESDPLVGSRAPLRDGSRTDGFTCQKDGAPCRIEGMPAFVTVRGGAYFFLPGLRALRYLASLP
ncbi:Dyp-type peroxidase [Sinorhizobium prairiense]|uniref:Dyp-type peroxidase n=1 Tax=unclassified Sinorhizobium TaxID=2613772 RepID=UPI0023D88531|nr:MULTISPECIES: peroxidase [unclassified Sinorhizobium]WEJ08450.1 peroxidase [Sinorhizobium sp. M103]WEJ14045.1 peroxidase [Sinorhizobium sp. K101]WEJ35646.1 peroxidase [Sinorhizobium sp. C101]